jgi:hypothetical protein
MTAAWHLLQYDRRKIYMTKSDCAEIAIVTVIRYHKSVTYAVKLQKNYIITVLLHQALL